MLESVNYLGHKILKKGLQPMEDKIRAITEASPPTNVSQLRSFLGLINYYGIFFKFGSHVSPIVQPVVESYPMVMGKACFSESQGTIDI